MIVEVNYIELTKLEESLRLLPQKAEYEVNNYMWSTAGNVLEKEIIKNMPKSKEDKSGRKNQPRTHARDDNSLEQIRYNLGIKVQTVTKPKLKDFGYLIFPNEGRGIRQKRKGKQEFFEKALDTKENGLATGLLDHVNKKIEKEI